MAAAREVSVVIAAYNAEATLGIQLEALSRQQVSFPFEVLVCDNGSTDGTAALAQSWSDRLPVRVVDASAKRGPGAARNAGAAVAAGRSMVFCDADDVVADDWLFEMRTALQGAEFVAGMCRLPYRHNRPGSPAEYYDYSLYIAPYFPQLLAAGAGNMGVRTELFRSVDGFDDTLRTGEDSDLCWRIQLAGHRLVSHPRAIITLTVRTGLRETFAQAYAYRAGERVLQHKYARVIEALRGTEAAVLPSPTTAEHEPTEPEAPARSSSVLRAARALRRIFRTRRLSDLTTLSFQVGEVFGRRFGRVDTARPQLDPQRLLNRA